MPKDLMVFRAAGIQNFGHLEKNGARFVKIGMRVGEKTRERFYKARERTFMVWVEPLKLMYLLVDAAIMGESEVSGEAKVSGKYFLDLLAREYRSVRFDAVENVIRMWP
jgi:hypothetical protein